MLFVKCESGEVTEVSIWMSETRLFVGKVLNQERGAAFHTAKGACKEAEGELEPLFNLFAAFSEQ